LHDSGLRNPNRSEHVVKVSERAADDRYVHLWIEGHLYATPSDAPSVLLACGRTITGANVSLQPRGKWSAPASSRMNSDCWRCPSCADALKQARVRPRPDRIANPADLGAFSLLTASEYQLAVTRVSGETHERSRHLPALPYHLDNRRRAYLVRVLRDVFSSTLPANPDELDALSRAHALVGAISSAASEGANPSLQAGWLRHLGITVTPALAKRLPLLTAADVGDLLRGLYPPAYHAGDWRALGDREAWGAWLASADYAQACAQLPAAVRARLATRRRRGALTATSSGFPAGH
jgi:hypothetical protein